MSSLALAAPSPLSAATPAAASSVAPGPASGAASSAVALRPLVALAPSARAAPSRLALAFAFAVIYLVWGSTFLGIRVAVETLPPLTMAAVRFLLAGGLLSAIAWARLRPEDPRPKLLHWRNAAATGALFFLGNHALVSTNAHLLPSSLVCLIIATEVPVIALLSAALLPGRPLTRRSLLGAGLGLLGVVWLFARPGGAGAETPLWPCLAILGASLSWSLGAVFSQKLELPANPLLRAAMQMTCGGAMLFIASLLRGEPALVDVHAFSSRSLFALGYLITFGSVLAFACYTFLLENVRTEAVATHVFVNPLVAVAVGAWLGGESLHAAHLIAGLFILASVCVITLGRTPNPAPEER